jgi:glucosamine-6-phosphate deaminase
MSQGRTSILEPALLLDHITRVDASSDFNGIANVPKIAITMGVSTILLSKRIVLLAWGKIKPI